MRPASEKERQECSSCSAPYAPRLTNGACPVCGTPSGAAVTKGWRLGPDDPFLTIVGAAVLVNLVILAFFIANLG